MEMVKVQPFTKGQSSIENQRLWNTAVLLLWLSLIIPAIVLMFSTTDEKLRDEAVLFVVATTIMAYLMFALENIIIVSLLFAPRLVIAVVAVVSSPKSIQWHWATLMAVFPIVVVFGILSIAVAGAIVMVLAWAVLNIIHTAKIYFPLAIYFLSFRSFVIRLPRYRGIRPFAESRLCNTCRRVLQSSSLLFGSKTAFARVREWHSLCTTLEDM
jgi:hypothetical protein